MKIISWQSEFTRHQLYTWVAFQNIVEEKITYVVGTLLSEARKQQGWDALDLTGLDVVHMADHGWIQQGAEIIRKNRDAIHVFGGFWADRRFFSLLLYALRSGVKIVVMNESYSEKSFGYLNEEIKVISWLKVQLRPWLYRLTAALVKMISLKNQFCILAIGSHAMEQFIRAGFYRDQLFPFGYFLPKYEAVPIMEEHSSSSLRIVFVGSLINIKGLDLAIKAICSINEGGKKKDAILDIYGPGNTETLQPLNLAGIHYRGVIPVGNAQSVIAQYDFLILPSRHDGWGVVVNEALLQGVPVIVSDQVGAKSLIEPTKAGMVFKSEDSDDLEFRLRALISSQLLRNELRDRAVGVGSKISPQLAASYMADVFNYFFLGKGERPDAIWCGQLEKLENY